MMNSATQVVSLRSGLMLRSSMIAMTMLGSMIAAAQSATGVKPAHDPAVKAAASVHTSAPDPGERKFQANCSRCHSAPEQISPRIAGTVVRHMRVHASLSVKDEQDILRYLAP